MKFEDLHSPLAESGVIATLIHKPEFIFHSEQLKPRDFYSIENQCFYWAIQELVANGVFEITDHALMAKLTSNKSIELQMNKLKIEHIKDILELSQYSCKNTVEEYKDLVEDIRDFENRRSLYINCQKMLKACLGETTKREDLKTMIDSTVNDFDNSYLRNRDIKKFSDKIDELEQQRLDRISGKIVTMPFHIKELNEYCEMEESEMVLFSAYSKRGKSSFLLSCAVDVLKKGKNFLIVDSELSDSNFYLRLLAHVARVPFRIVKQGGGTPEQREGIEKAKAWLKTKTYYHEYLPVCDAKAIHTIFNKVNLKDKVDLLIIDYFKADFKTKDLGLMSIGLTGHLDHVKNNIAGVYKIPVIGCLQAKKDGNTSFSSTLDQIVSTLVHIDFKTLEEKNVDGIECGNAKAVIKANRNGVQMNEDEGEYIDLLFEGDFLTYRSPPKQHEKKVPY